jgi:hypothetical protein
MIHQQNEIKVWCKHYYFVLVLETTFYPTFLMSHRQLALLKKMSNAIYNLFISKLFHNANVAALINTLFYFLIMTN